MLHRWGAGMLAGMFAAPLSVLAQRPDSGRASAVAVGLLVGAAYPVGEFRNYVSSGLALQFSVTVGGRGGGPLQGRVDAVGVLYGHESVRRPLSPTVPQVLVDVSTNNYFWSLEAGPQLRLGRGPVRAYTYGAAGFSYFATTSSVEGTDIFDQPFASSTNFSDVTWALSGGAGLLVTVSRGKTPVALAFDARYLRHGKTRYLREGSITTAPDGSVTITPIESRTNTLVFTLGVSIGGNLP